MQTPNSTNHNLWISLSLSLGCLLLCAVEWRTRIIYTLALNIQIRLQRRQHARRMREWAVEDAAYESRVREWAVEDAAYESRVRDHDITAAQKTYQQSKQRIYICTMKAFISVARALKDDHADRQKAFDKLNKEDPKFIDTVLDSMELIHQHFKAAQLSGDHFSERVEYSLELLSTIKKLWLASLELQRLLDEEAQSPGGDLQLLTTRDRSINAFFSSIDQASYTTEADWRIDENDVIVIPEDMLAIEQRFIQLQAQFENDINDPHIKHLVALASEYRQLNAERTGLVRQMLLNKERPSSSACADSEGMSAASTDSSEQVDLREDSKAARLVIERHNQLVLRMQEIDKIPGVRNVPAYHVETTSMDTAVQGVSATVDSPLAAHHLHNHGQPLASGSDDSRNSLAATELDKESGLEERGTSQLGTVSSTSIP